MKYLIAIFLTILCNSVFGQELKENEKDSKKALVYFIRGTVNEGYTSTFNVIVDGELTCKLNIRTYSAYEISAGMHEFEAQFEEKSEKNKAAIIKMDVEPGETYYFKVVRQVTFLVKDVVVKELTRKSALRLVKDDDIQQLKPQDIE